MTRYEFENLLCRLRDIKIQKELLKEHYEAYEEDIKQREIDSKDEPQRMGLLTICSGENTLDVRLGDSHLKAVVDSLVNAFQDDIRKICGRLTDD